jgi:hypothetical protein
MELNQFNGNFVAAEMVRRLLTQSNIDNDLGRKCAPDETTVGELDLR